MPSVTAGRGRRGVLRDVITLEPWRGTRRQETRRLRVRQQTYFVGGRLVLFKSNARYRRCSSRTRHYAVTLWYFHVGRFASAAEDAATEEQRAGRKQKSREGARRCRARTAELGGCVRVRKETVARRRSVAVGERRVGVGRSARVGFERVDASAASRVAAFRATRPAVGVGRRRSRSRAGGSRARTGTKAGSCAAETAGPRLVLSATATADSRVHLPRGRTRTTSRSGWSRTRARAHRARGMSVARPGPRRTGWPQRAEHAQAESANFA